MRFNIEAELTSIKNKLARWFSIYFPEYAKVYSDLEAKSGLALMKVAPMPEDIVKLGVEGIIQICKKRNLKSIGKESVECLVAAAQNSIGIRSGKFAAQFELKVLIEAFQRCKRGRKRLRYLLYLAAKPLVTHNPEFVELHRYYTKRAKKPLKKIQ